MDEDEPPMLVDSGGQTDEIGAISTEMRDMQIVKVPITIITGRLLVPDFFCAVFEAMLVVFWLFLLFTFGCLTLCPIICSQNYI